MSLEHFFPDSNTESFGYNHKPTGCNDFYRGRRQPQSSYDSKSRGNQLGENSHKISHHTERGSGGDGGSDLAVFIQKSMEKMTIQQLAAQLISSQPSENHYSHQSQLRHSYSTNSLNRGGLQNRGFSHNAPSRHLSQQPYCSSNIQDARPLHRDNSRGSDHHMPSHSGLYSSSSSSSSSLYSDRIHHKNSFTPSLPSRSSSNGIDSFLPRGNGFSSVGDSLWGQSRDEGLESRSLARSRGLSSAASSNLLLSRGGLRSQDRGWSNSGSFSSLLSGKGDPNSFFNCSTESRPLMDSLDLEKDPQYSNIIYQAQLRRQELIDEHCQKLLQQHQERSSHQLARSAVDTEEMNLFPRTNLSRGTPALSEIAAPREDLLDSHINSTNKSRSSVPLDLSCFDNFGLKSLMGLKEIVSGLEATSLTPVPNGASATSTTSPGSATPPLGSNATTPLGSSATTPLGWTPMSGCSSITGSSSAPSIGGGPSSVCSLETASSSTSSPVHFGPTVDFPPTRGSPLKLIPEASVSLTEHRSSLATQSADQTGIPGFRSQAVPAANKLPVADAAAKLATAVPATVSSMGPKATSWSQIVRLAPKAAPVQPPAPKPVQPQVSVKPLMLDATRSPSPSPTPIADHYNLPANGLPEFHRGPRADPRWPVAQQIFLGPIPMNITWDEIRNTFYSKVSRNQILHTYVQSKPVNDVVYGQVVFDRATLAAKILNDGSLTIRGHEILMTSMKEKTKAEKNK